MNIWHDISPELITPQQFTSVIEIPMGSKKKYEMDKNTGLLRLLAERLRFPDQR